MAKPLYCGRGINLGCQSGIPLHSSTFKEVFEHTVHRMIGFRIQRPHCHLLYKHFSLLHCVGTQNHRCISMWTTLHVLCPHYSRIRPQQHQLLKPLLMRTPPGNFHHISYGSALKTWFGPVSLEYTLGDVALQDSFCRFRPVSVCTPNHQLQQHGRYWNSNRP